MENLKVFGGLSKKADYGGIQLIPPNAIITEGKRGGIYNLGALILEECEIKRNEAERNGGVIYSGNTKVHIPMAGSPLIDANNAISCMSEDQRGYSRAVGKGCDIGAVEVQ